MKIFKHDAFPYILLFIIAVAIILPLGWARNKIDSEFLPGILVESFGFLMDVVFLGIFIVVFNSITEKKKKIERYKEEIDDYRGWDEKEAMYRTGGLIRRLNKLNYNSLDLFECFLKNANLEKINLSQSDLSFANLSDSILEKANLSQVKFYYTNLSNASLYQANLSSSDLSFAGLSYVDFHKADLFNVSLRSANITGARNLTYNQLVHTKTLYDCKGIPKDMEKDLLKNHPDLFKHPGDAYF